MENVWQVVAENDGLIWAWVCMSAEAAIDIQEAVKNAHPHAQVIMKRVTPYSGGPFVAPDALFRRKKSWL